MREENSKAIQAKAFKPKTTDSFGTTAAPNLLAEVNAQESAVGKIIIGDITYIRLRGGRFCYLAVWQDKVTRRIIGWSLALEMTGGLVISALEKVIRKGKVQAGAIVHSDRGSQYASTGFRQSMSGKGNCYDNAQAESFFSRFRAESVENRVFEDFEQARIEIFSYIEGGYNRVKVTFSFGL